MLERYRCNFHIYYEGSEPCPDCVDQDDDIINTQWVLENPEKAVLKIKALMDAVEPFAEQPSDSMDTYPCHIGICPKERCGRCGRAIAAWKAFNMYSKSTE